MNVKSIMKKEVKGSDVLYIIVFFLFLVGIILGSIYLSKIGNISDNGVKSYLDNFLYFIQGDNDKYTIFINALKENAITLFIIFAAGFFRIGFICIAAMVLRKGFIIGFTSASFIKYYGFKGMLMFFTTMPSVLILVPCFLIFGSISIGFSMKKEKKFIVSYIVFTFIVFSIFCVASFAEGYLTTIFMKWISPKII